MVRVMSKNELRDLKPEGVHPLLSSYVLADGFDIVLDIDQSYGINLFDSLHKKWYLDFFSYFASAPLSHNHPKMNEKEFGKKLFRVAKTKPSNSDIYTVELAQFVGTFARVLLPKEFKHLFFVSGGALGVENALKIAMDWKTRLLGKDEDLDLEILHFTDAFHGRTGYTLSLTNTASKEKTAYFTKFRWPKVTSPFLRFPITDEVLSEVKLKEEKAINQMKEILENRGDKIAAIIIEPVQAEGGDNHFRKEFFQRLRELADKYNVLLILDEVQSGCGLTGKRWAYEHFGIVPDLVAFGKKAQVCGVMATDRIDKIKNNVFELSSRINSTWGGNLVDMVRAQRYLEIIEEDNLIENAKIMGEYLIKRLTELSSKYSFINNVRGLGLMTAFNLKDHDLRNRYLKALYKNGLFVLPCGDRSIRFRPYLDIKSDDIDKAINILDLSAQQF